MTPTSTFEEIRSRIELLPTPTGIEDREIHWIEPGRMGIARDAHGAYEIFFSGGTLRPRSAIVSRHLEQGHWMGSQGQAYEASRVVLSSEPHFLAVSALIGSECVREGIKDSSVPIESIFASVEPILELALKRSALSTETIIGLIGELILLDKLLEITSTVPEQFGTVINAWKGYTPASRDFVLGSVAIEVKATRGISSSHIIHGLDQIEPREIHGNLLEDRILILSVGITPIIGGPYSLPGLTESILKRLGTLDGEGWQASPLQEQFLKQLLQYGQGSGLGYDHFQMRDRDIYKTQFSMTYIPRLYDMTDPSVRIIRRATIHGMHVNPSHIEYQMDLPETISSTNPISNWESAVSAIVQLFLHAVPQ